MSYSLRSLRSLSDCAFRSTSRSISRLELRDKCGESSHAQQSRRLAATSAAHKHMEPRRDSGYIDDDEVDDVSGRGGFASRRDEGRSRPTAVPYPKVRQKADPRPLVEHLENLFPSLKFPDVVASQALTHISAKEAWAGHNARLSFVGRRVLSAYLLLFIHSASRSRAASAESRLDFDLVSYRTLFTPFIGEKVGDSWDLSRVMLWTPPVRASPQDWNSEANDIPRTKRTPGIYKVQGTTVEAIMGGIYHQFGGTITQRVFHTRFLPLLLTKDDRFGLHESLHDFALEMQEKMGGPDALLMRSTEAEARRKRAVNNAQISDRLSSVDEVVSLS